MINKKTWTASFTLSGAIIGAGILGLPYVFAKSGFFFGLFWLIALGAVMMFVNLSIGEITLRTREKHQLTGLAEKYLGTWGKRIMFFAVIFGVYSALLAYLIGEGESFAQIIPGNTHAIVFGITFWLVMTLLLREGLSALKKVETWGVLFVIIMIVGIFIKFIKIVKPENLITFDATNFATPIGVIIFALLGFTSIPEIREEIRGQEKHLKRAIIIGSLIPVFLYLLFTITFVGVLGTDITEVATLSFGPIVIILGIFTMTTSYFVLSFSLKNTFKYDIKVSKTKNFIFTSLVPLILYVITIQFNLVGFILVLGIGGVISGGLTGILILLIAQKAKSNKRNGKPPEFQMPINWFTILILSVIFILAILLEILH